MDGKLLKPGDVLVTGGPGSGLGGALIRARSTFEHQPDKWNHVAMFTHFDNLGYWRGVEGKPGGFGWANLTRYIEDPNTISNAGRTNFTDLDREEAVEFARTMLGIPYDWEAIIGFAVELAGVPVIPAEWPEVGLPSQVVCSSAIDLIYEREGWPNPGGWTKTRGTDVDDWATFLSA